MTAGDLSLAGRRIAVLGAGPVGLEAALHAAAAGADVRVYEAAPAVAWNVEAWGHVTLFSPFGMNRTPLGREALRDAGVPLPPDDAYLTGRAYRERYLLPLAESALLAGRIETGARVVAVSRRDFLKHESIGDGRRRTSPFRILLETASGEREAWADVVLDCTGSYGNPNWMGPGGAPARGERACRDRIEYGLADVLGAERARYAGRRVLLVGGGHSAATAATALARLAAEAPGTSVVWATRRGGAEPIPRIPDDPLPRRDALAVAANRCAREPGSGVRWWPGAQVVALEPHGTEGLRVTLRTPDGERRERFDRVIANVGYVPDTSLYRELQIHECYATLGPMKWAAALLAAAGDGPADCLALGGFGPDALRNPEPDFFILGMKSYGRNSAFLLRTGYEQVRDALGLLAERVAGP